MSAASSRAGRDSGRDTALFVSIVFVAVVVLALHILRYGNFIADDAGITFAYAKNLARGHGLVLNPGTDPIEGYSNFAWLLVVLPFCAGGADPTVPIKALSFVLAAATLIAVGSVGRRIARESDVPARSWLAGLAPLGLAAFAPYAMWTSSGMENGLYCALFVAAIWFYLRESDAGCAIALLVLALTRVEGVGIAALFALHRAGSLIVDRRPPRRSEILGAAMFAALYAAYLAWHW